MYEYIYSYKEVDIIFFYVKKPLLLLPDTKLNALSQKKLGFIVHSHR